MYSRGKLDINSEDPVLTLLDKGTAQSRTGFSYVNYKRPEFLPLRSWIKPRSRLPAGLSELLQYQLPGFLGVLRERRKQNSFQALGQRYSRSANYHYCHSSRVHSGRIFRLPSTFALHKQKYSACSQPFFCLLTLAKRDLLSAINCDGVWFLRLYGEEGEEPETDSP